MQDEDHIQEPSFESYSPITYGGNMALDDKDESPNGSNWNFSTSPSSANTENENSPTGVSAFSTDPTQNFGDRRLSNWGEEPRIDDTSVPKTWSLWNSIARLFGAT